MHNIYTKNVPVHFGKSCRLSYKHSMPSLQALFLFVIGHEGSGDVCCFYHELFTVQYGRHAIVVEAEFTACHNLHCYCQLEFLDFLVLFLYLPAGCSIVQEAIGHNESTLYNVDSSDCTCHWQDGP